MVVCSPNKKISEVYNVHGRGKNAFNFALLLNSKLYAVNISKNIKLFYLF